MQESIWEGKGRKEDKGKSNDKKEREGAKRKGR